MRLVLIILLAVASAVMLALPATAQPAAAASAASLTPTLDTACGAAGTGNEWRYTKESPTRRVAQPVTRDDQDAKPGAWAKRVDAQGDWVACRMPPKAPDCTPIDKPEWGAGACSSGQTIKAGTIGTTRQVHDTAFKGRLYLACKPTGWAIDDRPGYTYCQR